MGNDQVGIYGGGGTVGSGNVRYVEDGVGGAVVGSEDAEGIVDVGVAAAGRAGTGAVGCRSYGGSPIAVADDVVVVGAVDRSAWEKES